MSSGLAYTRDKRAEATSTGTARPRGSRQAATKPHRAARDGAHPEQRGVAPPRAASLIPVVSGSRPHGRLLTPSGAPPVGAPTLGGLPGPQCPHVRRSTPRIGPRWGPPLSWGLASPQGTSLRPQDRLCPHLAASATAPAPTWGSPQRGRPPPVSPWRVAPAPAGAESTERDGRAEMGRPLTRFAPCWHRAGRAPEAASVGPVGRGPMADVEPRRWRARPRRPR